MIDVNTPGIDRRAGLSRKELLNEYVLPNKPVVLTDAVKDWPALGKWTPQFFKEKYGNIVKEINGKQYPMAAHMDHIMRSSPADPAPYPYNLEVEDYFPELMKDMEPQLVFGKIDRALHPLMPRIMTNGTPIHELFFGGHGSSFPFVHFDALYLHTQITQIYGDKEFILYHPDDTPYLYPQKENPKCSTVNNVFDPDLKKYPLFVNAKPFRTVLKAGETIFFPCGWWHTTMMYGPSISYGRIVLNTNNWDRYLNDKYERWKVQGPAKARLAKAFGKVLGGVMSVVEATK